MLLRVQYVGGFAPPPIAAVPLVSVYGDGRAIAADSPGDGAPALTPSSLRTLDPGALARLVRAAEQARLDESFRDRPLPDARSVVVTFRSGARAVTSSFTGLSPRPEDAADVADRRARAAEYVTALNDLSKLAGPDGVSAPAPYVPERVALVVRPDLGGAEATVKDWPAREVNLAERAAGGCTVLGGPQATATVKALTGEDARTLWREAKANWRVIARPLMPDQNACA